MIRKITLHNIQSHKDSELELDKGINVIIGSSNNGKSAILRGLYWAKYNRPLGIDTLLSHWAYDNKGNQKDDMLVTLENEYGVVTRKRTKNDNQYIVNDKILNVVKSDIPEEVSSTLRLSDTNIQKQLDSPFLLSNTSGEVAKYFNKVVRLDVIDRVLTNAESKRRKTKNDIETTSEDIELLENKVKDFDWIENAEKLIIKHDSVKSKYDDIYDKVGKLCKEMERYNQAKKKIDYFEKINSNRKIIGEIENVQNKIENIQGRNKNISNLVQKYRSCKVYPDFSDEKKMIEKLLNYNPDNQNVEKINSRIYQYKLHKMHIENSEKDIKCLKEQLPEVCPLCGKPMDLCKE